MLYFCITDQCIAEKLQSQMKIKRMKEKSYDSTGNVGKKILQHQEGVKHVSTDSLLSGFDMKLAHFEMIINRMRRRVISYTIFFFFPSYN